jgi:hypothetical protein
MNFNEFLSFWVEFFNDFWGLKKKKKVLGLGARLRLVFTVREERIQKLVDMHEIW